MQARKQQLELDMEKQFQIGKGVRQGCILSPCLFNFFFFFEGINFLLFIIIIIILLYNTVLVLPYIDMNPPWVYMSSQS